MTIYEIASQAGVSPATVSRYFNTIQKVSDQTRRKIERVLMENGENDKTIRRKRTGIIVFLIEYMKIEFFRCILQMFIEESQGTGLQLVYLPTNNLDTDKCHNIIRGLNPDGIVMFDVVDPFQILQFAETINSHVVIFGEEMTGANAFMIHVNDVAAAYEGTNYLLDLGHKKLLFYSNYPKGINSNYQRLSGCKVAMEEHGLKFDQAAMVRFGTLTYENGYQQVKRALEEGMEFTAVFAFSDGAALGAIHAILDQGRSVPGDISVLGFDDLPLAVCSRPQITTIRQPLRGFVRHTIAVFLHEDYSMLKKTMVLPHKLVERESCRAIDKEEGAE